MRRIETVISAWRVGRGGFIQVFYHKIPSILRDEITKFQGDAFAPSWNPARALPTEGSEGKCEGRKFALTLALTLETPINRAFEPHLWGCEGKKRKNFFLEINELTSQQPQAVTLANPSEIPLYQKKRSKKKGAVRMCSPQFLHTIT